MQYSTKRAYLELHASILLWGFTGILGRLITLNSNLLVVYRMLFTALSFLLLKNLFKQLKTLPKQLKFQLIGIGCVVALHWIAFYGSIHASNVSVAVGCMATTSLFTAFLEPLISRKKINWVELLTGVIVLFGLGIMFIYGQKFTNGIIIGIISAMLAATFTTLNKVIIDKHHPPAKAMSFLEIGGGFLFLALLLPIFLHYFPQKQLIPNSTDFIWIIILALVCTTLPFILSLRALKEISAFNTVLAVNLEPVYSIILAIIIFKENEELNWRFYFGSAIVILAVFIFPVVERKLFGKAKIS